MAILLHAWDRDIDISAFLEKGQQLLIQKFRVAAKIVVGIRADDAVKNSASNVKAVASALTGMISVSDNPISRKKRRFSSGSLHKSAA